MLEQNEMPPEEKPQPTDAQRKKLIAGVRGALDQFIRETAGDPGRVVLRRLTSAEYAYTIQDLTGLDLEMEKHFDVDPAGGEGFSNIGDVQFIQDSTLERYLEASKTVAAHAVIGAGPLQFYRDPGKTGQELSAINRIKEIYRQHGFRTASGEGGCAIRSRTAEAMACGLRSTSRPAAGLLTTSRAPPTSLMTIGVPQASASIQTLASPSCSEGNTMTSAAASASWTRSGASASNRTRPARRGPRVILCSAAAFGPLPTISSFASGM